MKPTRLLVAAALCAAGNAFALGPTAVPEVELFMAGATAQQYTIFYVLGGIPTNPAYNNYCADALDVYWDGTAGSNYRAYFCTFKTTAQNARIPATLSGKRVLINYRLLTGSIVGTTNLARGLPVNRLDVRGPWCTPTVPAKYGDATYLCANPNTHLVKQAPDLGTSDNEPSLFVGVNLPANVTDTNPPVAETPLNPTELSNITSVVLQGVGMGIAVNNKLYEAMQAQQLLSVGSLDNDNRPNLTSAQITSLLHFNRGAPYNKDWTPIVGATNGAGVPVIVCRRISGVGTQLTANAFWGGYPCSYAGSPPAAGGVYANTYHVIENNLIGDVKKCLNAVESGGDPHINAVTAGNSPGPVNGEKYAIGLLYLDNVPVANTDNWRFVKIDGTDPDDENIVSGKYKFFVEEVINYRKTAVGAQGPAPTAAQLGLINILSAELSSPIIVSLRTGFYALLERGYVPSATAPNNRVARVARFGNSCFDPQLLF